MPKNNRYIGGITSNTDGTPVQAEAIALFARMTTPPPNEYRNAMNKAIYRWKAAGLWVLIKGLWVTCAHTYNASLLSVIGDTARDAVIVGSQPPFVALKGFTGFDATHRIKFPITATILDNNYQTCTFLAAKMSHFYGDADGAPETGDEFAATSLITCDAGSSYQIPGVWETTLQGGNGQILPGVRFAGGTFLSATQIILGSRYIDAFMPGGVGRLGSASFSAPSSNYITSSDSKNALNAGRLCAYGFLSYTATAVQGAKFLAILSNLIDELGAFD
jgi:hypothetical protein